MDWFSAALGWLFLRTVVGGSVVLGMFYISVGQYVFAGTLLIPLLGVLGWMASDVVGSWPPDRLEDEN